MSKSLRINYIFNLINTVSQVLFPLITFPYASRIMLPDGIGLVNFFASIINYITLFACLGIPVYAIKAVASVREDQEKLKTVTIEIVSLNLVFTFIGYFIVGVLCLTVPKITADIPLFLILSLSIIFTTIGCEWFYKGIEDFRYITILGLVIKVLSVLFLFTLVKSKEDIILYGLYTVVGSIGGNIFNFFRLRKYVSFRFRFKDIHPFNHLKPVLQVFLFSAITSIYLQLNTVILGFLKDASDVGIYTTALKLFGIINGVIGSLAAVMLPRVSNLVAENNTTEIKRLAQKAYDFSFTLSLPMIIGVVACSPYLIHLFCGDNFMESVTCIQIMAPIMLFLSISSLLGYQILYPMGHLNLVIGYCLVGSLICIVLDFSLIPKLTYIGVSISYLITEMAVAIIAIFVSKKYIRVNYFSKSQRNTLVGSLIMASAFLLIFKYIEISNDIAMMSIYFISGVIVYSASMLAIKDELYTGCVKSILTFFSRK